MTEREPRPQAFAPGLAWRGAAIPAGIWVPLLLAAVLVAMVGGMLIGASWPPEEPLVPSVGLMTACPPGVDPDEPGPVDQSRPIQFAAREEKSFPAGAAFDRRAGRLVVLALAAASEAVETWTFDACANAWTQMHPRLEPRGFDLGRLVYDVDSDRTILVAATAVWVYDLDADRWTELRPAPSPVWVFVYDPLSGLVAARGPDPPGFWNYRVETDTWTPMRQVNAPDMGGPAVYDASVDRIVFPGAETSLFDIRTGIWSRAAAEMPQVIAGWGMSSPDAVYDEAANRTVVIGNERLVTYDANTDRYEIVIDDFDGLLPLPAAYDSVNGRLIALGRRDTDDGAAANWGSVLGLDLATRAWAVLLESR